MILRPPSLARIPRLSPRAPLLPRPSIVRPIPSITYAPRRTSATTSSSTTTTIKTPPSPTTAPSDPIINDRPIPPPYTPPTTGLLSLLPPALVPYAELIRLDKPTGTYYLLLPCLWSTLAAGILNPSAAPSAIASTAALFAAGALIMRGAGCTINDYFDRTFDAQVSRTWHRPIARGAIPPDAALGFLAAQLLAGWFLVLQFPVETVVTAVPSLALVALYPLCKRVTNYPQVVLGMAFSWGAVLGFPALGVHLLDDPAAATAAAGLVLGNTAWTVMYDSIYAHMDLKDDLRAGVKSIVVAWDGRTRELMTALAGGFAGGLGLAGWSLGLGPAYWGICVGAGLAGNLWKVWTTDLRDRKSCWEAFAWLAWAVGGVCVGGGLAVELVMSRLEVGWYKDRGRRAVEGEGSGIDV